jgi:hypothetical protein
MKQINETPAKATRIVAAVNCKAGASIIASSLGLEES